MISLFIDLLGGGLKQLKQGAIQKQQGLWTLGRKVLAYILNEGKPGKQFRC